MKDHRCNCDASCSENRYHDAGTHGCRFQSAEEFEAYWQNIHDTNKKWIDMYMKPKEHKHKDTKSGWEYPPEPDHHKSKPDPTEDTMEGLKKTIKKLDAELNRTTDALKTIGALFKTSTASDRIFLAWQIVDETLAGKWPAYGITPRAAKEYDNSKHTHRDNG